MVAIREGDPVENIIHHGDMCIVQNLKDGIFKEEYFIGVDITKKRDWFVGFKENIHISNFCEFVACLESNGLVTECFELLKNR